MAATSLTLRLARLVDAAPIAAMSRDLIETGLGWRYRPDHVRRLIADRETLVLVACHGDHVAGFAIMEFGDERAHLVLLAVEPAAQRLGHGRRMMTWLIESAMTAGIASIHLELRVGNTAGRDFYRAMGFAPTMVVRGYYHGRESAIRMVRVLRPLTCTLLPWQMRFPR